MSITLITGGTRSGKSSYALTCAKCATKPFYIATGWIPEGDLEMEKRIEKHKQERGKHWSSIEEKTNLIDAINRAIANNADFIIVDCLTFWTSNIMMNEVLDLKNELSNLEKYLKNIKIDIIFVTNEVGSGIVPENKLARKFRDYAGLVNQKIAQIANNVFLSVSGIPFKIK